MICGSFSYFAQYLKSDRHKVHCNVMRHNYSVPSSPSQFSYRKCFDFWDGILGSYFSPPDFLLSILFYCIYIYLDLVFSSNLDFFKNILNNTWREDGYHHSYAKPKKQWVSNNQCPTAIRLWNLVTFTLHVFIRALDWVTDKLKG